jgi:uncharacterized protein YqhQ
VFPSLKRFIRLAAHTQLLPVLESGEETLVGGQAVLEGVMMRAPHSYCIAVRKATGEVVTQESALPRVSEKYPIFKLPVLNGQVAFNLTDGVIRLSIFLGFLFMISRWKDIRRVFEYHGAEHKVVFNFESGKPVTIENARTFTTLHPRCGTSFLLVVMVISMVVYAALPFESFAAKMAARVILIPVITGISYELIRFAAKRPGSLLSLIAAPGLWLQRITTQPPADDQTEVAIRALEGAMVLEGQQGGELVIA